MADEMSVSHGSAFNILHKKLHAHPYKPIYSQELYDGDDEQKIAVLSNYDKQFAK